MQGAVEEARQARLILVPTPIGNLGDITFRAVEVLRDAHRIVAEDTRRTRKLLSHLGLDARRLQRLDANASEHDLDRVVGWMVAGEVVALVTDAGTPSVSDPGSALVRCALKAGIEVTSLPGPSAVTVAVASSGLVDGSFSFLGFAPRGLAELTNLVEMLGRRAEPCVLFESPNRLGKTLEALADAMPDRQVVIARELTKLHEELVRGTVREVASMGREWVGEITVVLGPWDDGPKGEVTDEQVDVRIDEELAEGVHTRTVAGKVAAWSGRSRRDVYVRVVERMEMLRRR
jgi:16S rRNA (cytidine1402-2'-O)-methyltransferase